MTHFTSHPADAGAPDDRPAPSDLDSPGLEGTYAEAEAYYAGPDTCDIGGIKCGSCKERHPHVSDIRWCYDLKREAMAEAQAEQAAEAASEVAFARDREAIAERGTWFGPQTVADTWGEGLDTPSEPPF